MLKVVSRLVTGFNTGTQEWQAWQEKGQGRDSSSH
jgi:hypothetical protein